MRKLIVFIFACALTVVANAQVSVIEQIEQDSNIVIKVAPELAQLLEYHHVAGTAKAADEAADPAKARVGYRVQVFDDNNPRTAQNAAQERKNMIENRFPEFRGYVTFNSPYWRVKVGDFKTRSEAEAAMGAIRAAFPQIGSQLRVVRDKINLRY